jgi:hypothetical protein
MRSITRSLALAAIAALSITGLVAAGDQRPIEGSYTVSVVGVAQRCGPNALTIGFEGTGIVSHLGRITGEGSNCTEFTLATDAVGIWDGLATFVAADGSTISTSYEGVQHAPVAGAAVTESTFTVVSGTGRFADAAGVWTGTGTIDFTTGVFSGTLSGWISY